MVVDYEGQSSNPRAWLIYAIRNILLVCLCVCVCACLWDMGVSVLLVGELVALGVSEEE